MPSIQELFQQIIDHPDMTGIKFSLVFDNVPDFPVVVDATSQDQHNEEVRDVGSEYLFEAGQVRFEVSDGIPGDRNMAYSYVEFLEAYDEAVLLQCRHDKRSC